MLSYAILRGSKGGPATVDNPGGFHASPNSKTPFWPDTAEKQALTNLRKTIHLLRQTMPEIDHFVEIERSFIQWRSDASTIVDVQAFEEHIAEAEIAESPSHTIALLQSALELYAGELLPSCYDDWIRAERTRLRAQYLFALKQLSNLLERQRNYELAIQLTRRLLYDEPLDEAANLQLMRLYMLNGEPTQARLHRRNPDHSR